MGTRVFLGFQAVVCNVFGLLQHLRFKASAAVCFSRPGCGRGRRRRRDSECAPFGARREMNLRIVVPCWALLLKGELDYVKTAVSFANCVLIMRLCRLVADAVPKWRNRAGRGRPVLGGLWWAMGRALQTRPRVVRATKKSNFLNCGEICGPWQSWHVCGSRASTEGLAVAFRKSARLGRWPTVDSSPLERVVSKGASWRGRWPPLRRTAGNCGYVASSAAGCRLWQCGGERV